MKAINVYAGAGTLTRAFQNQGVEIVWAQEDSDIAAQVYQYNFPNIPFYKGKVQEIDVSKIPECDLLLASIRLPRFSLARSKQLEMSQNDYSEIQKSELEFLKQLIIYKNPKAVCIALSVNSLKLKQEIIETLMNQNYFFSYQVMSGEQHSGLPFKGQKIYIVGFLSGIGLDRFDFPPITKQSLGISQLLDRSQKKEEIYYRLPEGYKKLFLNIELKNDEIYQVVHRRDQYNNKQLELRVHTSCPILTSRSSRDYFVVDVWGPRRLSATEYLQLQGIDPEMFIKWMDQKSNWSVMSYIGIYQLELKLAVQILKALRESVYGVPKKNIQEQIADYLIREFELFPNKKRLGLLCMPIGAGKSKVLKYSISELIKITLGKCKVVILAGYHEQCKQIEHLFRDSEISFQLASSCQEINQFMLNEEQLLISSYMKWEAFINQYQPVGIHSRLIIFGMDTEVGWRCLRNTKEYLPQVIYTGLTSIPDNKAIELFGPVLYQYEIPQAIKDGLLLPVSVEQFSVDIKSIELSQSGDTDNSSILHTEKVVSTIAEGIWEDLNTHGGKAIIIANSIYQAQELKRVFDIAKSEGKIRVSDDNRDVYLYISSLTPIDRERNLSEYINSPQGILIVVDMWTGLSVPDIAHSYVLSTKTSNAVSLIIGLVSRPFTGKRYGRIIVLDESIQEEVQSLINIWGGSEQFLHFCDCLREGKYEELGVILRNMKQTEKSLVTQIERELSFLFIKQLEANSIDQNQLQFMTRLWLLTSKVSNRWLSLQNLQSKEASDSEENISREEIENQQLKEIITNQNILESKLGIFKNSAEKGSTLENTLLRLLHHLFIWDPDDNPDLDKKTTEIMAFLRKATAGTQNGRDIELVYMDETRQKRRCYFECKYIQSKTLKEENILAKILQVQRETKEEIEHWILVAPNARLDNYSVALIEDAERNPGKYYPIKNIQVWNEENRIQDLLGIEPEMYNIFFKNQEQVELPPDEWGKEKKQQIIQTWKQKLAPVILLPEGLRFYPFQPKNLIFDLQNNLQERKKYEDLYQDYARLYYYNENGILSQECLEEDIINWLYSSTGDIKVIIGEYGDGKTFFLYCLCRKLLKEFSKNPQKNYLPIFVPLKSLKIDNSPEKLIERRMRELGCKYSDFQTLKENFHILICLDGFDEMSSTIDCNTIQQNTRLLAECCEYFCGTKIIITSRKQCFYENHVNEWLYKRLGGFEVLSLAPVKLMDRESFILSKVEENDRLAKWEQLNATGKIQTLMGKPFFLDMMRQLLESGEKLGEDSIVSIYEHYIRNCLIRKFYVNFEREHAELPDEAQIVNRIYNALQSLAYILQKQGKEDLHKSELEKYLGKPLTEVLWLENEADDMAKQDAGNRFSMRTLLKYGENGKVTFSHRSLREYFVAVHLVTTMDKQLDELRVLITDSPYNYEILSFVAEQIKSEPERVNDRVEKLISLINLDSGSDGDDCDMSLAAKVMQILYYINKTIPKAEWNGKNLSGINVPGANFSEQNFFWAKFLNANLNNVILDGCDCSYCDMSGARLGETNKIAALKFDGEMLLSLYKDGSIRKWDVNRLEEISCIVGCAGSNDAVFGNGTDLFVQDNSIIELLGKQKNKMITNMRYRKKQDYKLLSVYEGRILINESRIAGDCISLISVNDFNIEHKWNVGKNSKGIIVNNQLTIIYDGDVLIELYSIAQQKSTGKIDVRRGGEISVLAVYENNGDAIVALGYDSGEIHVYQCSNYKSEFVAKGRGLDYGLSHLVFCGASTLAAANSNGEICLLHISYNKGLISMDTSKVLKLGIYCKGIKTEGLIPEDIRMRLESRA